MIAIDEKYIRFETKSTTLLYEIKRAHNNPSWDNNQFKVFLEPIYYGEKIAAQNDYEALRTKTHTFNTSISCFGNFDNREPMLLLKNADGSLVSDFSYVETKAVKRPVCGGMPSAHGMKETAEIVYEDERCGLRLINSLSVSDDCDAIVSSYRLENRSSAPVTIMRLMSLQLDLTGRNFTIYSYDGAWGRERYETKRKLDIGVALTESLTGTSSHTHNPFFMLCDERFSSWYGFNLIYSGSHKASVEVSPFNTVRVMNGINDFAFEYDLAAGETFYTPQSVLTYAGTKDDITLRMHEFVRKHIVRGKFADAERPIVVNNWEATYFDFTHAKIMDIAKTGAELGAELFVLDDGWFSTRNTAQSGLGDWYDNMEKTGGLNGLARDIRGLGLKFGIWIEPEMVNIDSELFRRHPEYASLVPGREPMVHRFQYSLDLSDNEVAEYVYASVCCVIELCSADYVKWDFNRIMTEFYSPKLKNQGEYDYRYMCNLYSVLQRLIEKFPDVLFESCAGGGGRFDLGLLCFMPQVWTSDNTDARMRVFIQQGTLCGYPQNTLTAHVSHCPNYLTKNSTSLENRFNVAAIGCLGYEFDLSALTKRNKYAVRCQIKWYKKYRRILQKGNYYVLDSIFDNEEDYFGWIVVSEDKTAAVAMIGYKSFPACGLAKYRLKGLKDEFTYKVCARKQDNAEQIAFTATGKLLNNGNIDFGAVDAETDRAENSGSIYTKIFAIEKI